MGTPLIALLPGALMIYLGYNGGGYFPPAIGVASAVVAVALVLQLTLAERPLDGLSGGTAVAGAGFGLLAVWTLASSSWSDAPGRAILDFDRLLLYLLTFLLLASLPRTAATARWLLLGLTGAAATICLGGLLTRVLPDVFPVELSVLPQRLSYPITYWNGLGLVAALAIVGGLHLASSAREHPALRVAASALLPVVAVTLYFTFSRASIAVTILAVVAYAVLARPRGLASALVAVLPVTVVALKAAYDADLLAKRDATSAAAVEQGHEVALVLAGCAVLAALIRFLFIRQGVDARLERVRVRRTTRRATAAGLAALVILGGGASWVALDLGERLDTQYERFKQGDTIRTGDDARRRLTQIGNNGRIYHWDAALDAWHDDELKGTGAGTYELAWAQQRQSQFTVRDAHSLYVETLSELGLIGAVLLAVALGAILVALARRTRGHERPLWAALFVGAAAWALHAAQDWDWELPGVSLWVFAAGGLALARPPRSLELHVPRIVRVVAALFILALTVTPVLAAVSHSRLRDSVTALKGGDCEAAIEDALGATSALSSRAEPYAILAFCDARLGKPELAERMMQNAIDRDPEHWVYHYGMALVRGAAGKDPRPQLAVARRLNPLEPLLDSADDAFASDNPKTWKRRALEARLPID